MVNSGLKGLMMTSYVVALKSVQGITILTMITGSSGSRLAFMIHCAHWEYIRPTGLICLSMSRDGDTFRGDWVGLMVIGSWIGRRSQTRLTAFITH